MSDTALTGRIDWTVNEDNVLFELYPYAPMTEVCASLPRRTYKAILYRAELLRIKREKKDGRILYPVINREGVDGKVCIDCQQWKPLERFGRSKSCMGGRKTKCTTCESRHIRETYPEITKKALAKYRKNNPEYSLMNNMRARARKAGATIGPITVGEIRDLRKSYGGLCSYCRIRSGDTIDHVIPLSRGGAHDISNLVPACFRCNHSKKNRTPEEWFASDAPFNIRK